MAQGRGRRGGVVLIVLIIIVLIVAVGALFLLRIIGQPSPTDGGGVAQQPTSTPEPTAPPTTNIIVADRDIPRGARLSVEDVTIMAWPMIADAPPPLDALVVGGAQGAGLEQVEGRIARVSILRGQPVLNNMLTPGDFPDQLGDTGSDAALLIPSGQVALAMPINRLSAVAYALREGDHVDLLMSFQFVDVDEDFQTILPNSGVLITDQADLLPLLGFEYFVGREENGAFGTTLLVMPSVLEPLQRPRQATQLMIDNIMVLRVGYFPLTGINEPIVVTAIPPATQAPADEEGGEQAPATQEAPPPTPTPPVVPDIITLVMSRQDALVLKYAMETGALIDMALRSALDDDINDIQTDTVTLSYIIDFYNLAIPPRLPVAQDPRIDSFYLLQWLSDQPVPTETPQQ